MYCQKCRTAFRLDPSLEHLNPASFDLLIGSTAKAQRDAPAPSRLTYPQERKDLYDRTTKQPNSPIHRRVIPAPTSRHGGSQEQARGHANPAMSFIEITESQIVPVDKVDSTTNTRVQAGLSDALGSAEGDDTSSLSWQMRRTEKIFSILSSFSDIDHPICTECTSDLLKQYSVRLASATRERDAYAAFLKKIQQETTNSNGATEQASSVEDLKVQQQEAMRELEALEQQKRGLEEELADLEEESQRLDIEERNFWASRNAYDDNLHEMTTNLIHLQQKFAHDQEQLERLQRTNVYNDTFCIGHDGSFGTINGLRLGRLPGQNVEWAEINAAWGQTLLLLATLAERLGFSFKGWRLRPLGSTSRIEKLEYPQQAPEASARGHITRDAAPTSATSPVKITGFDLFSSGDLAVGRVFNYKKFDQGMIAFLDCLAQLGDHVERISVSQVEGRQSSARIPPVRRTSSSTKLPYKIQGDKINDVSIKLGVGFSQDESFTTACKYALTCCKYLLAYVSNPDNNPG